jgi:hypothetical protein
MGQTDHGEPPDGPTFEEFPNDKESLNCFSDSDVVRDE